MNKRHKIAFYYLDDLHHIYHFIGPAVELSKTNDVSIVTYKGEHDFLYNTIKTLNAKNLKVEQLSTKVFRALTDKLKKKELPRKGFWIKKNWKHLLHNFDAIVFTDYNHEYILNKRSDKDIPKLIKLPHGAVGRQHSYKKEILDFDLQILFGSYHEKQFKDLNLLGKNYNVVGYPKIDITNYKKETTNLFDNNNPIVLYNPHFSNELSSWDLIGLDILEFFYKNTQFNLVFAPHIHTFKSRGNRSSEVISKKYFNTKNIHIDLGSHKSVDMSYLKISDIYLGDISSQVYEFIIIPRPCLFLNPKEVDYQNNYAFRFWNCGAVINDISNLDHDLNNAISSFSNYKEIQNQITNENFYFEEGSTASQRTANAINSYLDQVNS